MISDLFADVAEHRGTAVTIEAIEFVRGLYGSAVDAASSPKHATEILEQQLADADRGSRRSSVRGDVLGDALLDRKQRIADLQTRLNQLEAERNEEQKRADERADVSGLIAERDVLQREVERLGADLREAQAQRAAAEDRQPVRHPQAGSRCRRLRHRRPSAGGAAPGEGHHCRGGEPAVRDFASLCGLCTA
ncbi:hypothetical protein [Actinacidiphila glaucinigra]|uniref:hypothetical protein n=1 Tax=Actinacidiphila glaucinigra TaxID=235986 RepID=UPI0035DBBFA1